MTLRSRLRARLARVGRAPSSSGAVRKLHHLADGPWKRRERVVALTFDDGPFPDRTPELLDVLGELEVPATFFLVGRRVDRAPEVVARLREAGHLLANHAYTHRDLRRIHGRASRREILAGRLSIRHHSGVDPAHFRPPFSAWNDTVHAAAQASGQTLVLWSVSVNDGSATTEEIVDGVLGRLEPGAIVLLHELPQTIAALPAIVAGARRRGYRFVTLGGTPELPTRPASSGQVDHRPLRRIASVTPAHTAGLVLADSRPTDRALLCHDTSVRDVGYATWAAVHHDLPLVLASRGRLGAPYRMQLERLTPRTLVRIGSTATLLDGENELPTGREDFPDPVRVLDHGTLTGGRWLVTGEGDPATVVLVAATAARIGAGVLIAVGEPGAVVRELRARDAAEVVGVGPADDRLRRALEADRHDTRWLEGTTASHLAVRLAQAFPSERGVWLVGSRHGHHTVAAAVAAGRRGAALLVTDRAGVSLAPAAVRRMAVDAPITVVGDEDGPSDEVVAELLGATRPDRAFSPA